MSNYLLKAEQEFRVVLSRGDEDKTMAFFREKLNQSFGNGMQYARKYAHQKTEA